MESTKEGFVIVGPKPADNKIYTRSRHWLYHLRRLPILSIICLTLIVCGCLGAEFIINHNPLQLYLNHLDMPPNSEFYFGTDSMGRDIYSIIWYGGRISLFIGLVGTSTLSVIGIVYGCISGMATARIDALMMRFAEMMSSIPNLLLLLLLLSITHTPTPLSIGICIGITNWMNLARIVRSEVRQLQTSEFILVAKTMGASFKRILLKHLLPNFFSSIMFMIVSSIGLCIRIESTLSFLGVGLPVQVVSWGSMLSLANKALLTNSWWVIVFPGIFLIITLLSITNIGDFLRSNMSKRDSNL